MISFSQEVKNELCNIKLTKINNIKAELSGIILVCFELINKDNKKYIKIKLTNVNVVRRVYKLLKKLSNELDVEIVYKNNTDQINKATEIIINNDNRILEKLLDIDIFFPDEFPTYLKNATEKLSFIRGIFLARGSISNPQKGYNININTYDNEFSDQVIMLCLEFDIILKKIKRSRAFLIYAKGGEQIGNFLRCIGSVTMMYEFENIRIIRDAKNYATRTSNFDNANITKTIKSSQEIIKILKILMKENKLEHLNYRDQKAVEYRIKYPEYSLNQICEKLQEKDIKISKSTISTLFTKLKKL